MSERAIHQPDERSVRLQSSPIENLYENSPEEMVPDYETWPLLDNRMQQSQISSIVDTWHTRNLYHDVPNTEKPRVVLRWLLEQTHVIPDASHEKAHRDALAERDRRLSKGLTLSRIQKSLGDLTQEQKQKLDAVRVIDSKVTAAQSRVETETANGFSNLLEFLEELESHVMDHAGDANIVKLFNGIDDKTGGRVRELIIAKRTLVVMIADELPGDPN